MLKLALFSYFALHSLWAVAMFFLIFSKMKINQSFTVQNFRLCLLFLVTVVQVKKIYLKPPFFKWTVTTDTTNHNISGYILIDRLTFWVHVVKIKSKSLVGLRATKIRYTSLESSLFGCRWLI